MRSLSLKALGGSVSESTISQRRPRSSREGLLSRVRTPVLTRYRFKPSLLILFLFVAGAELAFGMWMNSRGFLWNDGINRATGALLALFGASAPQLTSVGFVWMPLPSLVELLWVSSYPLWPGVVSSGFASTFTTALAGGATAALLLYAARSLGLPGRLGWAFALLVAADPMLFLYGSNGMSEGVAAPFLTGAVAFLVLFWRSGKRRYVAAGGLALALGFASLYEAVAFGAALFAAMVLGILFSSENKQVAPRGQHEHLGNLVMLFLTPSLCVAALWVGANAFVMGDPLFFAASTYSNLGIIATADTGLGQSIKGSVLATFGFTIQHVAPFLIPGLFLLLVRALDGRFWRINTLSLVLLLGSVPLGLIAPLVYLGASFGWLRYFVYPLFVAAGWGLYEVASSPHRRRAAHLVLLSWIVAAPVLLSVMADPSLGRDENPEVRALMTGKDAREAGFDTGTGSITRETPVAQYLSELPEDSRVALDTAGWSIAAQVSPERLKSLILIHDSRFRDAINDPKARDTAYLLLPNPSKAPNDLIGQRWPSLWSDGVPGFEFVESFPGAPEEWRLYKVTK
jgi:hypothetical protein